ncbi:MAG: XrtA/PEP-CTERM system amidotransferase [Gammaproteobacteria bacterium]
MCGITGIYQTRPGAPVDRDLLARMNDSISHRGPDDSGLLVEPGVGLGHRRLSIIDLSGGHQPLFNEDGSVAVVFNGEIYNYRELGAQLRELGHQLKTLSDTEVIVHAWEQWGVDCVHRFRGMFAFAVWDRKRQSVFLARDRLGIKGIYWSQLADGTVVFGSELKALMQHPDLPRRHDPEAVEEYFSFGYIPEPRSIYTGVYKLPPGCHMLLERGRDAPQPVRYWDVPFESDHATDRQDAEVELIERLREAVRIRLIAEVPLGAFLSGGVDSSAVVALMAEEARARGGEAVKTCSIAFGEKRFNETEFAAMVAQRYSTAHRVEQVDPDAFDLVDTLAGLYDEPFADSSALPTYRVCELARRSVTVALSGDGGDENFAGYTRYRWHMEEERLRGRFPDALRRPLFGALGQVYPTMAWAPRFLRARATFKALGADWLAGYFRIIALLEDHERQRLYSPAMRSALQGYSGEQVLREHAARSPTDDPLGRVQYLDYKTYLPGDILTKVDRASMAHALEVRVPVLDHEFVAWSSGLPADWKMSGGDGKRIFKKALEPFLPDDVLYRPKKGFAVPLGAWFRGPLRERLREALLGERMAACGLFDRSFLARLLDWHDSGRRDMSATLWALLMFEAFLRREDL